MERTQSPAQIASALLARSRVNIALCRRTRQETAQIISTSAKAIAESRDALARSRNLTRAWRTDLG